MKHIRISDKTLRQASESLNFREKMDVARLLSAIGADDIELPVPSGSKADVIVCSTIASSLTSCGAVICAGTSEKEIDSAWECVKCAYSPCLQIEIPVSTVQMEYSLHLKAPKMLELIASLCRYASSKCKRVRICALDATRADISFLRDICRTSSEIGVEGIVLCDDAGVMMPSEYKNLVSELKKYASNTEILISPSDELHMSAAIFAASAKAGADGVITSYASQNTITAETVADIMSARGEDMSLTCGISTTDSHRISSKIRSEINSTSKETYVNAHEQTPDINLTSFSTISDITASARALGYDISEEDTGKVWEEFRRVAERKDDVGAKELEAIIASCAMQVPSTYHLDSYVSNSGNVITATANVTLIRDERKLSGVCTGDGPIDAAFRAIDQIVGHHYELDDFQIQAVTQGREAVGSALVRIRSNGKLYSGNGISTDIIGASIRAYLNALNKIVYEEN